MNIIVNRITDSIRRDVTRAAEALKLGLTTIIVHVVMFDGDSSSAAVCVEAAWDVGRADADTVIELVDQADCGLQFDHVDEDRAFFRLG